jgi:hypothetical protein
VEARLSHLKNENALALFNCERSSSDSPSGEGYAGTNSPVLRHRSFRGGWTIEDEQCQKIGGGYKAVKFGFLLFL